MVMDTEVTSSAGEVAAVNSVQASSTGVMVSPWSPSGVEKVWYEFINAVKPGVTEEQVKEVCSAMRVMQFSSVRMFQGLLLPQLMQSRSEWGGITDEVWDLICFLHSASVPEPTSMTVKKVKKESGVGVSNSPALQVVGLLKMSTQLRTNRMLRQVLGLRDDAPMPKPSTMMEMFARSMPVALCREYGVNPSEILQSLATQGVLESLEPNSRLSYCAGINSWISFCVMIEDITPGVIPVEDQLKVTEDLVRQWLTLIPEFKTAASYVSHLKMACALAKESVSWHTPLVKAQVKSKLKKDVLEIPKVRWVCQKETLLQMVEHAESQGMEWLAVLLIVSYTFQWRVYSEYFKIAYVDIHFHGMDKSLGEQKLELIVNRRKNRPYRHPLVRDCVCKFGGKKGEVKLGPKLCAVHRLWKYLQSDPVYNLAQATSSPQFLLMQSVNQSRLNRVLKDVALAIGDPMGLAAASHGMRRGYACDLAVAGASLKQILEDGDWRSEAFREYIASVKDQLHNRALVGILGDNSDDE